MRRRAGDSVDGQRLAAYLEGEVTPSEAAEIERALADSASARRDLDQLRNIRDVLSRPMPELQNVDLVARVRRAAQAEPPARHPWWGGSWPRAGLLAAAACVLVGVGVASIRRPADRFQAKGGAPGSAEGARERWAGIQVFRVDGSGKPERATDRLRARDGLLFSYTNVGPRPFEYLMIFGVDARGEVRWFHPAYEREGTNPASIPVAKGEANVPLPELIHHDFAPGPLVVHALFTMGPLRVLEVEALLREHPREPLSRAVADAAQQSLTFRVVAP